MPTDEMMQLEDDELLERSARSPRRGGMLAGLALVLALGAVALSGWLWWQTDDAETGDPEFQAQLEGIQQGLKRQKDEVAALESRIEIASGAPDPAVRALESELQSQKARNRALEQEIDSQASLARSLQQAVESMQARLTAAENLAAAQAPARVNAPAQLDLAAVDYLLRLAPERLTLFHDLRSADQALALADAQLEALDNPMFIALRRDIADARQALAEADLPNTVRISARLDAVQRQLTGLAFDTDRADAAPQDNAGAAVSEPAVEEPGWWERLKASMSGLVTVRRAADEEASRLTLADKDMLRQGVWMQIEGARLALMRHDQAAWADALKRATALLVRWFDTSSQAYGAVEDELQSLAELDIAPELPDISGPWAQLKVIRQVRAAPSPAEELPQSEPPASPLEESGDSEGDNGTDSTEPAPDESG